jgi:hypothetical protein
MFACALRVTGRRQRYRPSRQNRNPRRKPFMKRWNVWAALRRPRDMKGNSNRPNGVVVAVFCVSSGWTGI